VSGPKTVVVVNARNWLPLLAQLSALLGGSTLGSTIPDPSGVAPDPEGFATIVDPTYWAEHQDELANALTGDTNISTQKGLRSASGAAPTSQERLTLTVEEAASLLGISRAFAYESVHRGDIPSIRLGRRILIPRSLLEKLVDDGSSEESN
jgi:excisionase family DNA binding protein